MQWCIVNNIIFKNSINLKDKHNQFSKNKTKLKNKIIVEMIFELTSIAFNETI